MDCKRQYLFVIFVMIAGAGKAVSLAQGDVGQEVAIDKLAGDTMVSDTLKLIYQTILNVAYALFLVGVLITLATDADTRNNFFDYLQQNGSVAFIIVMVLLAVLVYSLGKAYSKDTKYTPLTKRSINFIQDIVRGTIYLLMVIFITSFVKENSGDKKVVVAYWIYIISMILFKILHVLKWYYFLCGRGKNNLKPWTSPAQAQEFLDQQQKQVVTKIATDALDLIKRGKHLPELKQGNLETIPASQRQLTA